MATTTAKKKGIHFAWFVLIGVLLMMGLCRGGINSGMGLFFQPISADMHIGVGEVAMMSSISALITMFWSPFAGRLLDKFDIRIITVVAVAIQAGCFAALSLVDAVWGFYALAGIMAFGSVFATQLVGPMMINRWFKDKNGLAMGIMMSFVAICSAVLSPVVASIIASNGWRMGYIVLGVLALVIVIPAVLIWFRTPEQKGQLPLGATEADIEAAKNADPKAAAEAAKNLPGLTSKQALKTPTFWFFFIFMVLLTGTLAFASIVPTLAIEAGFDTVTSGFAMTAYMIGTAIAAVVFGTISDKLGPPQGHDGGVRVRFHRPLGPHLLPHEPVHVLRIAVLLRLPVRHAGRHRPAGAGHAVRPEGIRLHLRHRHDGHRHRLHDPHPGVRLHLRCDGQLHARPHHDLLLHRRLPDLHDHGLQDRQEGSGHVDAEGVNQTRHPALCAECAARHPFGSTAGHEPRSRRAPETTGPPVTLQSF